MTRDMSAPNWARTVKRLQRYAQQLRQHDVQVIFPPDFETPPEKRYAQGGPVGAPRTYLIGEHGPEDLSPRHHPLL